MRFAALVVLVVAGLGCSPTTLAGPCRTDCDCTLGTAPIKCPGEWFCNANFTCEYQCRDLCGASAVSDAGCPTGQSCSGTLCSGRVLCH